MPRILFFSPYIPWAPHTLWEITMALALQQRRATVKFITCAGLPDCAIHPKRLDRTDFACMNCHSLTRQYMSGSRLPYEFLQVADDVKTRLRAWVDGLPAEQLREACWQGLPLGEWVEADVVAYYMQTDLDTSDIRVAATYRDYLFGAAVVATGLPALIESFAPDSAVLLNGTFFMHRTAFELLRARGVRVVTHERGLFDNTIMLTENAPIWHGDQMSLLWDRWKEAPLNSRELFRVGKILQDRRGGQNMGWVAFSPKPQDRGEVLGSLGLPAEKPLALLCTSVEYEASQFGIKVEMPHDLWIEDTINWFAQRRDVSLVIRCHPCDAHRKDYSARLLPKLEARRSTLPDGIRMILPHEEISTYTLMDLAAIGITYGSTVGIEMGCMGLPVVHIGRGLYKDAGFTLEVPNRESYPAVLEEALRRKRCVEVSRLALRFAYHYFFSQSHPMTKVRVDKDYTSAALTYSSATELAPGRDPHLDWLVSFLLGEAEIYPFPHESRLRADTSEEDRFLAVNRLAVNRYD